MVASASEEFHVILACRTIEKASAAVAEIEAGGIKGTLSIIQLEVTNDVSSELHYYWQSRNLPTNDPTVKEAVAHVAEKFGKLDVLVNNAGIAKGDSDLKTRFRTIFEVNVFGPATVSEEFRPLLLKSSKPYSIYVSSCVGSLTMASDPQSLTYNNPYPNGSAYRSSKSALNMIAIQESVNFASTALKVFAFCPGLVESGLRGPSELSRTAGGHAKSPETSGEGILRIIQGKRDADAGKFVHAGNFLPGGEGAYPW